MRAVFVVNSDGDGSVPAPHYEIRIGFNGIPGKVALEVAKVNFQGFSGGRDNPVTEERQHTETVCRTVLDASYARAIASAMLSAATETARGNR